MLLILLERQVGDDASVDAVFDAFPAKVFEPEPKHRVQITHQDQRDFDGFPDVRKLPEQSFQAHAVPKSLRGCVLDHFSVGHRIAERDADFDQVDSPVFEGADNPGGAVGGRVAGAKIDG